MKSNLFPDVMFPNLDFQISKLPREAFSLFGIPIYWYGILIMLGVLAGITYACLEAKRTKQKSEDYMDFAFIALITSLIGARLYYVIFSWDLYKNNLLSVFNLRNGGLAIYGAIIFAVLTAYFFTKIKKLNFANFADTAVPGLVIGQAIGRFGNFFNREAFGGFTDSLFAMCYPASQVSYIPSEVATNMVYHIGTPYIQVHPTFLYEAAGCILIFAFLNIYKYHKKFAGELVLFYFVGYGILRTIVEDMRTDQLKLWGTDLAVSQILSVILAVSGIVLIIYFRRKMNNKDDSLNEGQIAEDSDSETVEEVVSDSDVQSETDAVATDEIDSADDKAADETGNAVEETDVLDETDETE